MTFALAEPQWIDELIFGQDRITSHNDRPTGHFTIDVSSDGQTYQRVFDNSRIASPWTIAGSLPAMASISARFEPVRAGFVRLNVAAANYHGPRIDEVEIIRAAEPASGSDSPGEIYATETFAYDNQHRLATRTDRDSVTTTLTYDVRGRIVGTTVSRPGTDDLTTTTDHDADGRVVRTVDVRGNVTTFGYDDAGRVVSRTDRDGTTWLTYDDFGRLQNTTAPDGSTSRAFYDALGRTTGSAGADGAITAVRYDESGRPVQQINATGAVAETQYDPIGRVQSQTDPGGGVTSFAYDPFNRVVAVTGPLGGVTNLRYDAADRPTRRWDDNRLEIFGYDDLGQLAWHTVVDMVGLTDVDPESVDPAGLDSGRVRRVTVGYDVASRPVSWTDAAGRLIEIRLIDPDGDGPITDRVTSQTYDDDGNVTSRTDAAGRVTRWTYDARGRVLTEQLPDPVTLGGDGGAVIAYRYNAAGQVDQITDVAGGVTDFGYDEHGREVSRTLPAPSPGAARPVTSRTYDQHGRIATVTDPLGATITLNYNAAGQLVTVTLPDPDGPSGTGGPGGTDLPAPARSYRYDAAGQLIWFRDEAGVITTSTYTAAGRLETQTVADPDGDGPLGDATTRWDYDAAGNVLQISQLAADGQSISRVTSYVYDALGREVTRILPDPGVSSTLGRPYYTRTYDAAGQLASVTDATGATVWFGYDVLGRLTTRTDPATAAGTPVTRYQYVNAGNLTATIDPAGSLTQYHYDAMGRRTVTVLPAVDVMLPGGVSQSVAAQTSVRYDDAGRVISTTDAAGRVTFFAYDALKRQVSATTTAALPVAFAANFDPDLPIADHAGRLAVPNGAAPPSVASPTGQGVQFGGPAKHLLYLSDENTNALGRNDGDFSYSYWVRPDRDAYVGWRAFLNKGDYGANGGRLGATFFIPGTTRLHIRFGTTVNWNEGVNTSAIPPHQWTHVAVVKQGRQVRAYLNGQLDTQGTLAGATLGNDQPMVVGHNGTEVSLDDVRIVGRALTVQEIGYLIDHPDHSLTTATPDQPVGQILSQTSQNYDAAGRVISATDPLGHTTRYQYDALGRITATILPAADGSRDADGSLPGPTTWSVYDAAGNLAESIDELARVTTYDHDGWGRVTRVTGADPDGDGPLPAPWTQSFHDHAGNVDRVLDHLGRQTTTTFDDLDRVIAETLPDPDGNGPLPAPVRHNVYDQAGRVTRQTDAAGRVTRWEYDAAGQLIVTTLPDPDLTDNRPAPVLTRSYDLAGNHTATTDAAGRTTIWTYDAMGQLRSETSPDPDGEGPAARSPHDAPLRRSGQPDRHRRLDRRIHVADDAVRLRRVGPQHHRHRPGG